AKTIHDVLKIYESSDFVQESISKIQKNHTAKIHGKGQVGSSLSLFSTQLMKQSGNPILLILDDKEEAVYVLNELETLFPREEVLFLPDSYKRPYEIEETNNANVVLRTEVLNTLNTARKPRIVVTYAEGIFEKVVTKKSLSKNTMKVAVDSALDIDFLNELLFSYEFHRVDFVSEPGELSIRGGIVDIYSYSDEKPYRISLFGNEVESSRTFDVETQLSIEKVKEFTIVPNLENKLLSENRESFFDYISPSTIVLTRNISLIQSSIHRNFELAKNSFENLK